MIKKKARLDNVLVEREFFNTIEEAKRAVMAGLVYTEEERLDTPGQQVSFSIPLTIKGQKQHSYVSRGGLKLEKALKQFGLIVANKTVIDIGSSTGGFTDCALQNGAKLCYAVDVGYNQLAWKLRQDNRVIVMERTNFRYLTAADLTNGLPEFATIDVSFISLELILPVLKALLTNNSNIVALVKPQFEASRGDVGEKGIVRNKEVHEKVINKIISFAISEGYVVNDLSFSPITGGNGNIEFLLHLKWFEEKNDNNNIHSIDISNVVNRAHENLIN